MVKESIFVGYDQRPENKHKITYSDSNFFVFPSLGQIDTGYLLIVPRDQYRCMAEFPEELMNSYSKVKSLQMKKIKEEYKEDALCYEHGILGQTIPHAHLHLMPHTLQQARSVLEYCRNTFPHEVTYTTDAELPDLFKEHGLYNTVEFAGSKHFFHTGVFPQFGRFAMAQAKGVPEFADWKKMNRDIDNKRIQQTVRKLKIN